MPASDAGFKPCFHPYNSNTTCLCAAVCGGSLLKFFIVLFLMPSNCPRKYHQIYLLQIPARNIDLKPGVYSDSSTSLPCETDIGVSAITK